MKKSVILALAVLLLVLFSVVGTTAYLISVSAPAENTFTPAVVTCAVEGQEESGLERDVSIKNTGNAVAFIRAMIVVNWEDQNGNIYAVAPQSETDYTITLGADGWVRGADGFYYYTKAVQPGDSTAELLDFCNQIGTAPEGYALSLRILASAVQAGPERAAEEAWGVIVTGDTLNLNG